MSVMKILHASAFVIRPYRGGIVINMFYTETINSMIIVMWVSWLFIMLELQ